MRRANKILMATVAVLLCLVLISTSIVSGVFARFAITKKAETTVKLEQFGVTIELTPVGDLAKFKIEPELKKGDSVSMTFSNIDMAIGDSFLDTLKVKIYGEPTVPVELKFSCYVNYDDSDRGNYWVDKTISKAGKNCIFMPLGYTIGWPGGMNSNPNNPRYVCRQYHNKNRDEIEEIITRNVANELFLKNIQKNDGTIKIDNTNNTHYYTHPLDEGKDLSEYGYHIGEFYLGFHWPHNYSGENWDYDAIATHISEKASAANSPITFTYTFSIVQVS